MFTVDDIKEDPANKDSLTLLTEANVMDIKDIFFIFTGTDFYFLRNKKWDTGMMCINTANTHIGIIPDNCSIVSIKDERKELQNRIGQLLITGGYYNG